MSIPQRVIRWVEDNYKRPRVDPQWLNECYNWLIDEGHHDPETRFDDLVNAIKYQILESNLSDSMLPGTGLPTHVAHSSTKTILTGQEIYVEIAALTEIGNSAFSLNQTRLAREERMKEGNVNDEDGEGDIDIAGEGPMPKYSRSMLRFELTDGTMTVPAIEYRSLPEMSLETTPLGFKLLLKNVRVHKGILWLEPKTVVLLGHKTDEREENRENNFTMGLRARMRLPVDENNVVTLANPPASARQASAPPLPIIRSPLREISPPPSPTIHPHNDDEDLEHRRRRIPKRNSSPPVPSHSHNSTSSFFANSSRSQTLVGTQSTNISLSPTLRQARPNLPLPFPSNASENEDFGDESLFQLQEPRNSEQLAGSTRMQPNNIPRDNGNIASGSKGKGKRDESSDEYGDDDMFDNNMFADLDAIEKAYVNTSAPAPASAIGSRSSELGDRAGGMEHDVIEIESDDDDKENAPVPTRHIRQCIRGGLSQGTRGSQARNERLLKAEEDIVELSDSDSA